MGSTCAGSRALAEKYKAGSDLQDGESSRARSLEAGNYRPAERASWVLTSLNGF
jgi:hypothetical protein